MEEVRQDEPEAVEGMVPDEEPVEDVEPEEDVEASDGMDDDELPQ